MAEENKNPFDLIDKNAKAENTAPKKESGLFLKKLVKGIAKIAGLPDPETGEPAKASTTSETKATTESKGETTLEQDIVAQEEQKKQEEEKKKFSFDSVMSGVTGVLDKIEKKVEDKTGLDFDAPLKKREERLNNEQEAQKQAQPEQKKAQVENDNKEENPIEKNNEEYLSENH